jgi:hypothetical protein
MNNLKFPLPKDDLYQVSLKLASWFWKISLNDPILFLHFCNYLPFKEDLALYLNNLQFPLPKNDFYQVIGNWLAGSGEEGLKKISVYFYSFAIISPWARAFPFI